jgi:hypothetical protein
MDAVRGCSREISYDYSVREKDPANKSRFIKIKKKKTVKVDIPAGVSKFHSPCLLSPSFT